MTLHSLESTFFHVHIPDHRVPPATCDSSIFLSSFFNTRQLDLLDTIAYFLIDARIDLSHLAGISEIIGRLDPFFKILSSWISCQFLILLITPIGPLILQYLAIPVARWLCSLIGASPGMHRPDITIAFAACLSIFCETLLYLFKRILFFF